MKHSQAIMKGHHRASLSLVSHRVRYCRADQFICVTPAEHTACRVTLTFPVSLLRPRQQPPAPGFAPWLSLTSIAQICGTRAIVSFSFGRLKRPSGSRHPK
jgi:hypothetical protein